MEPGQESKKKRRFLLIKLEERVVPAHLPTVHVAQVTSHASDVPGIERAGEANHSRVVFLKCVCGQTDCNPHPPTSGAVFQ